MTTKVRTITAGTLWKLFVKVGDRVKAGDKLFIMEVMKTEVLHEAPVDGIVTAVYVTEGQDALDADFVSVEIA
jgi:biotin carboxyl carrier protein